MTGTAAEQPNILLVVVDQLADCWLDMAITPALDRLAAQGVRFGAAYSNSPLCAPARFAMMSGRPNSAIGAFDDASEFPAAVPTFAHHLRAAGYQTSLIGKMHFVGPDQLHGFEERLTTDIYPADFGWTPDWSDPDGRFDRWSHNMDSVTGAGIAEASNQLDYDDDVGFRAVRKLRDLARSDDRRPWFVTVSFTHPHDPYVARRRYWDLYDHDAIADPTVAAPTEPDPHSRRLLRLMAADATEVTSAQIRNARHAYLANTSYVDGHVGELLELLARLGLDDETVVIFTADHGDMLGERGLWYKMNFFEPSARVPLIIRAPRRFEPATVGTVTSLIDIAPTLLDLAGVEPPDTMAGSSVLPLIGGADPGRAVFGEYLGEGALAPILMIRRCDLKYVWSEPDPPQLYDLAVDPHELTNIAGSSPSAGEFEAEVLQRWDVGALRAEVLASQRDRAVVDRALRQGRYHPWDHQPLTDASNQYMRNHLDLNTVEATRRLP